MEWLPLILLIVLIGCTAGFLAGMLGVGGGIVLVPGLYYGFGMLGYDTASIMHLAVGTSLAVIIPTGLSSARAHWKRQAVDKSLLMKMGPGIVLGVLAGTCLAGMMSGDALKTVFAVAIIGLAIIMIGNPSQFTFLKAMPPQPVPALSGVVIGTLSTLMGIGGATVSVPFMSLSGVDMRKAVGTASALGLLIAVPGTLGFTILGGGSQDVPPFSIGYVNVLAWLLIVPFSVICAPLGAHLAHGISITKLRRVFAVFMVIVALRMLADLADIV